MYRTPAQALMRFNRSAMEKWEHARSSLQLGVILHLTGLVGGIVSYVEVITRGGPDNQPNDFFAWQLWLFTDRESLQTLAMVLFFGLSGLGLYIVSRVTRERRWDTMWLAFAVASLFPLQACWPPALQVLGTSATELTSISWPRWIAVCVACSVAQLIFGWQAWLLRTHHYRVVLAGVRSGSVFLLIVFPVMGMLFLLRVLSEDLRAVINGEVWALLGAAQLIVALTAGVGERKAAEREVQLEVLLKAVHGASPEKSRAQMARSAERLRRRGSLRKHPPRQGSSVHAMQRRRIAKQTSFPN